MGNTESEVLNHRAIEMLLDGLDAITPAEGLDTAIHSQLVQKLRDSTRVGISYKTDVSRERERQPIIGCLCPQSEGHDGRCKGPDCHCH